MNTTNHTSPSGEELKRCPFCGSAAEMKHSYQWWIQCANEACGAVQNEAPMDPKGAADAWNRRAALAAEKVAAEPVAIYQAKGSSEYLWNDVSRAEFARTDPALRRIVYAAPQQPAQSAEQDERAQLDVSMLARLSAQIFDCPLNPTISKFARAVEANVRAASTQATRHARKAISDLFAQETNNG